MSPSHDGQVQHPYKCKVCSSTYTRKENLKRHEKKHTQLKYTCRVCSKDYSRIDVLKVHMKSHAAKSENVAVSPQNQGASPIGSVLMENIPEKWHQNGSMPFSEVRSSFSGSHIPDSPLKNISNDAIEGFLGHFWDSFYPTFPILHKPTFSVPENYLSDPLTHIMCAIGAKYVRAERKLADKCFSYCMSYLNANMYISDTHPVTIDIFQTGLLAGYAGLFWGNTDWYKWASRAIYELILLGRENGMFQDSPVSAEEAKVNWGSFITLEKTRRASYALFFIDGQMSTLLNNPPKMSHYEIKHILPCEEELWDAQTETDWKNLAKLTEFPVLAPIVGQFSLGRFVNPASQAQPDSSTRSLRSPGIYFLEALQKTLVSGSAPPKTSSFGGMIILLTVHIMIRNMTQFAGILETYFALAQDPYSRRNQLGNALNGLRFLIPRNLNQQTGHMKSMWGLFEVTLNLALIHLHLPDTAITSGIVEPDLEATIATAAALTQPQSITPPGTAFLGNDYRQFPYETLALVTGHSSFFLKTFNSEFGETNPSLTYMFYKVTLVTWSVLRSLVYQAEASVESNKRRTSRTAEGAGSPPDPKELQKEFMFKHLAVDILSHVDSSNTFSDIKCYEQWVEHKLKTYNTWGVGPCGAGSFTDMLKIGDTL